MRRSSTAMAVAGLTFMVILCTHCAPSGPKHNGYIAKSGAPVGSANQSLQGANSLGGKNAKAAAKNLKNTCPTATSVDTVSSKIAPPPSPKDGQLLSQLPVGDYTLSSVTVQLSMSNPDFSALQTLQYSSVSATGGTSAPTCTENEVNAATNFKASATSAPNLVALESRFTIAQVGDSGKNGATHCSKIGIGDAVKGKEFIANQTTDTPTDQYPGIIQNLQEKVTDADFSGGVYTLAQGVTVVLNKISDTQYQVSYEIQQGPDDNQVWSRYYIIYNFKAQPASSTPAAPTAGESGQPPKEAAAAENTDA